VRRHELPELLARVLAGRGVEVDEAVGFLDPTVKLLMPDPSVLTDMPVAAARLADAVTRGPDRSPAVDLATAAASAHG
jgi:single-stranded-DNA-specific exonuclease